MLLELLLRVPGQKHFGQVSTTFLPASKMAMHTPSTVHAISLTVYALGYAREKRRDILSCCCIEIHPRSLKERGHPNAY
jgi:hypothetical protein